MRPSGGVQSAAAEPLDVREAGPEQRHGPGRTTSPDVQFPASTPEAEAPAPFSEVEREAGTQSPSSLKTPTHYKSLLFRLADFLHCDQSGPSVCSGTDS